MESGNVAPVDAAGLGKRQKDERGQRHNRQHAQHGREPSTQVQAVVRGQIHEQNSDDGDDENRAADRCPADVFQDVETAADRQAEQRHDVGRGQDHVDRGDREPAEPVRPPGETAKPVRATLAQQWREGLLRVGRHAAVAVGPHHRQLGQTQTEHQAENRVQAHPENRGRTHALHGERGDSRDENGSGQTDDESAPPVRRLR